MAVRKKNYRFYVYCIGGLDNPVYIGKGSGARLKAQIRHFGAEGVEVARFYREKDAFAFERKLIKEFCPKKNKTLGGDGGRVRKRTSTRRFKWEIEIDKLGSNVYAARMLLRFDLSKYLDLSKIEQIRQVAYGSR